MIVLAELHNLIRSLNKPEKRFFKLLSATENVAVDKAVVLFDFIEKIDDKEDVYYHTDKADHIDLSNNNIDLLYNLILKSQRNFYSETITAFSVNDELTNLKILFEKAQYKQCRKMVKALKERALNFEKFNYLIEIIELEKNLLKTEPNYQGFDKDYRELLIQQDNFIEQEKNVGEYYRLYSRLKFQVKSNSLNGKQTPTSFYEKFLEQPAIRDGRKALSKKALLMLFKCRALCYTALKSQALRCRQLIEAKELVDQNDFLFHEMTRYYIDILYNLVNAHMELNELPKVKQVLSEMNAIINSKKIISADLNLKLKGNAYIVELLLLTYTARFREAHDLSLTISEFISVNERIFNKEDKSVLLFNLANFYIYNANYQLAERVLDKLLAESDKKGRWDIKAYTRIQQLIVCFELKQYSRLPLIIPILKKLIKEKVFTALTEIRSIEFFEEIINSGDFEVSEKQYKAWHNELKGLMKIKKESWTNFFYFNFYAYSANKAGIAEIKDIIHENYLKGETI